MCNKVKFAGVGSAKKHIRRKAKRHGCRYRIYFCRICTKYHITTQRKTNLSKSGAR